MINSPDPFKSAVNVPSNYSINLMWLNNKLNEKLPYINNSKNEDELLNKLLDSAKEWKDVNQDAEVVIWYDKDFVTEEAIKNTQEVLDRKKEEGYNIVLKDIREIDLVKANPDAFSSNVPIYFRVDILKLIICVNSIVHDSKEAAIFADVELCDRKVYPNREDKEEAELIGDDPELTFREQDGKPPRMSKEELFDDKTMKKLKRFGCLIGGGKAGENQFAQLMKNEDTIQAIMTFINIELSRVITALNMNDDEARRILIGTNKEASQENINKMKVDISKTVSEMIFKDIPLLQALVLSARSQNTDQEIKIRSENTDEWIKYIPDQYGIEPLGNLKRLNDALVVNQESVLDIKDCLILPDVQNYAEDLSRGVSYTKEGAPHFETITVTEMPKKGNKFTFKTWESVIKDKMSSDIKSDIEFQVVQDPVSHNKISSPPIKEDLSQKGQLIKDQEKVEYIFEKLFIPHQKNLIEAHLETLNKFQSMCQNAAEFLPVEQMNKIKEELRSIEAFLDSSHFETFALKNHGISLTPEQVEYCQSIISEENKESFTKIENLCVAVTEGIEMQEVKLQENERQKEALRQKQQDIKELAESKLTTMLNKVSNESHLKSQYKSTKTGSLSEFSFAGYHAFRSQRRDPQIQAIQSILFAISNKQTEPVEKAQQLSCLIQVVKEGLKEHPHSRLLKVMSDMEQELQATLIFDNTEVGIPRQEQGQYKNLKETINSLSKNILDPREKKELGVLIELTKVEASDRNNKHRL